MALLALCVALRKGKKPRQSENVRSVGTNSKETSKPLTNKQFSRWQLLMKIGYKVCHCHQLPERSFFFHGMQFPVCARCTGILLGFFILGPVITIFTFGNMYVSMGLVLLMVADGVIQMFTKYESNNIIRVITGLGFGYGCF